MAQPGSGLLLAYYGDDFTGSTDALEFLSRAGAKTVLFMVPPTAAMLAKYEGLHALGIAGVTRSMKPDEMEATLLPAFAALKELQPRHVHYKVCSTFDSSPAIGSIGKAIDTAASVFKNKFIPVLVAAPALGRYSAFGNLFARMGIGSNGVIYRLDRHPSMSKHPVTPATEGDLRLHLAKQTDKTIGLLDIIQVNEPYERAKAALDAVTAANEVVFIDAMYAEQLKQIGQLIDSAVVDGVPQFSVGSSGIEMSLGDHWKAGGKLTAKTEWQHPGAAEQLLVISGSCSPVTSGQIAWAEANGYASIAMDTAAIAAGINEDEAIIKHVNEAVAALRAGKDVLIHTSRGNDDERVGQTNAVLQQKGYDAATISTITGKLYGEALGTIADLVLKQIPVKRLIIAGGDTSGFAARKLGIEAVEMIAPLSPGAPLCRAFAPGAAADGIEVNFKGGQVGKEDYFGMVKSGEFKIKN